MNITQNAEQPTNNTRTLILTVIAVLCALSLALIAAQRQAQADPTFPVVYTVNMSGDANDSNLNDGKCDVNLNVAGDQCTLRAALNLANYFVGGARINFDLPSSQGTLIAPGNPLPAITDRIFIDGYTQPGASPNTLQNGDNAKIKVTLNGLNAGDTSGLHFMDGKSGGYDISDSVVQGLSIYKFNRSGIEVEGGSDVTIGGNFIGTDHTGTQSIGNGNSGVSLLKSTGAFNGGFHQIGGVNPEMRNVIAGNHWSGIYINTSDHNIIRGNYIGTDYDGTDRFTNDDMGHEGGGVDIYNSAGAMIGGTDAGTGNVISNGDSFGVEIGHSQNVTLVGNRIGTDRSGKKNLGNHDGVEILDSSNIHIGSGSARGSNTIAFSDRDGVRIDEGVLDNIPNNTLHDQLSRNAIFSNKVLGIDLEGDGVTPNDAGDADTGANNLQNRPVLSSAKKSAAGKTTIRGKLNSSKNQTFSIEFFSNPKDTNQGKKFLGSKTVTTDGSGNVTFTLATTKKIALGQNVTVTASSSTGDTSEFSAPRKVVAS
jgi:hypothetical protein